MKVQNTTIIPPPPDNMKVNFSLQYEESAAYLERTEITVVILDNLGWKILQHISLQTTENKWKDLSVKRFHG